MVVCVCANVSDEQIKEVLERGEDPSEELGVCQNCCVCRDSIVELGLNTDLGV